MASDDGVMVWLLTTVAFVVVVLGCRDLRMNFRSHPLDEWREVAHSRARVASLAGAVSSPLLFPSSDVLAVAFCVASVGLFWLVPNGWLAKAPKVGRRRH